MSNYGPVPKRSDQRRRVNAPAVPITKSPAGKVAIPEIPDDWHPIAKRWFAGLAESGQSVYYEQSDWEIAYATAESLSRDFKPKFVCTDPDGSPVFAEMPLSGSSLGSYLRAFAALLATEADRRRSSLELQRASSAAEAEEVSSLDDIRRRLRTG